MATTPLFVGVDDDPLLVERGDSEDWSFEPEVLRVLVFEVEFAPFWALPVVAGLLTRLFFLLPFFLVEEFAPLGPVLLPVPRLRFLMMSVLSDSGRTTPCSFKKRPQALQRGLPSAFLRQRGVV